MIWKKGMNKTKFGKMENGRKIKNKTGRLAVKMMIYKSLGSKILKIFIM